MTETNKREHEHDCLEQVIDGVVELGDNQSKVSVGDIRAVPVRSCNHRDQPSRRYPRSAEHARTDRRVVRHPDVVWSASFLDARISRASLGQRSEA